MSILRSKLSRLQHLSDETISRLIAGELNAVRGFRARFHLEKCWQCRSRREAFERAAMQVTEHRNRLVEGTPINPQRRELLLSELRHRAGQPVSQPMWIRSISNFRVWIGNQMSPIVTSAAIVLVAVVLLVVVWRRTETPVTAGQLLQRAIASDASVSQERTGVIYQKVRITTPRIKIEHEVYRDPHGVRRRVESAKKEPVQDVLSAAGVDWDSPLSAASYAGWHDKQPSVTDKVRKSDDNLLTMVSKVQNSWIKEETLTVRASDFHPVARTIETRAYGTIEIAELSYAVLPWSGVNEALFEPLAIPDHANPEHENNLILPAMPTPADLDSAELSARLVLNELHADEGEQINVSQGEHGVEVKGVVETNERKQEIVQKLRLVPHVKVDVLSIAELQSLPRNQSGAQSVTMQSVEVAPSPLAKYLGGQGDQKVTLGESSQGLLDAALKVRQNASELGVLKERFSSLGGPASGDSTVAQLSESYSMRLLAGLDQEVATLGSLGFVDYSQQPSNLPNTTNFNLATEVDRNESLCRELIAGSPQTSRPVTEIVPELYRSIARIRQVVAARTNAVD